MDKKNGKIGRRKKISDEEINENDIINLLDDSKKRIPIQMRRVTSSILKNRIEEHEKWEKETNAVNVHVEHLQEELDKKDNEIKLLKETIKDLENKIEMEKNKNNEFIDKKEKIKNNIFEITKIINNMEI
jgi:predicted  nucleic acid-binding Zn-ribbon protein